MKEFYSNDYCIQISNKKKKLLKLYIIISVITVLLVGAILLVFSLEPYGSELKPLFLVLLFVIGCAFVFYTFLFFTIIYGRVKKYYNYLYYACYGKLETTKITITHIDYSVEDVMGVDFYSLTALYWSDIIGNYFDRKLYIDSEVNIDDIKVGDVLTVKINSNCIVAYQKENAWKEVKLI